MLASRLATGLICLLATTACQTQRTPSEATTAGPTTAGPTTAGPTAAAPTAAAQKASSAQKAPSPQVQQEPQALGPRSPEPAPTETPPAITRPKAKKTELDALNAWAQSNGLAQNLAAFAALGLPMQAELKSTLNIQYNRVEGPDAATVLVLQEGYLDDSLEAERFTLRFARKVCDPGECPGPPPWILLELAAERRCKPGRGHEDYSSQPCQ